MATNRVIEVQLPDGAAPTRDELAMLQATFDSIVALRFEHQPALDEIEKALVADGWTVRSRLMWVAEAKKGGECEEATGASRIDALRHLQQLVRAEQVMSAP